MSAAKKIYVTLDDADKARTLLHAIDWPVSYWLGSVTVHVVPTDHRLAWHRHLFDVAEVLSVEGKDEAELWRLIADRDRLMGAPPRSAIVVTSPSRPPGACAPREGATPAQT